MTSNQANAQQGQTDAQLISLCESAFHAEHYGQFDRAYELHSQAIQGLNRFADDAKLLDRDRRRSARKQIKFHTARRLLIQPLKEGKQITPPPILPTSLSAQEELLAVRKDGALPISLEELWLAKFLKDKASNPSLVPDPQMQHLVQNPVPFYSKTLDPALPPIVYKIDVTADAAFTQQITYYKVKLANDDRQTLYVLQIRKRHRYQIPMTMLHRSSEFTRPCIQTTISGVRPEHYKYNAIRKGRAFQHYTASSRVIQENPDRVENKSWDPRRFTYGGRQFVWVMGKNEMHPQDLYEVETTWPKPGSKTGKREHRVVGRKLAWGESKISWSNPLTLYIAGGIDQMFREYILASQLTRMAILIFGHD